MSKSPTRQPFAVFDIDGTLIRWQLYHAIVDALVKAGHMDEIDHAEIRRARMDWKERTHNDSFKAYERQLIAAYDTKLVSISPKHFDEATTVVFNEYKDQVYTYTRNLIAELKAKGYLLFAISGSQTEIISKIADYYGFTDFRGSTYPRKNGQFTGAKILHKSNKHIVLAELIKKHDATYDRSIAVGDSSSDITMLEAVEQPIAFNPDQKLYDEAKSKGWKIVVERKNVIYKLESDNGSYLLA